MEWFIAVVVVVILGVAAMAAAGGMGEMRPDPVFDTFRQDLPVDGPLTASDLQQLRFGVSIRGYSMRQVDDLLDRLTREIAERDARINEPGGGDVGLEQSGQQLLPEPSEPRGHGQGSSREVARGDSVGMTEDITTSGERT